MSIVGFNFTKVAVERTGQVEGEMSIDNNVRLLDVEEIPLGSDDKNKGLRLKFEYTADYKPDMGTMAFHGEVLEMLPADEAAEAVDKWKKDGAIHKDLMKRFVNAVFRRCTVLAILQGREVNLPPPVRLPRLKEDD